MAKTSSKLPAVTIVIEWENAIDVEDEWTGVAMAGLERELARSGSKMEAKPRVLYMYDETRVDPAIIRKFVAAHAPKLEDVSKLELVPTPGMAYYDLKNLGISKAKTDFAIVLDSDAAPQPGWLEGLLKPFKDPKIMVVAGFTVLAHEDVKSRAMALSWFFDLPSEPEATLKRERLHANNFAVRTSFFADNPFPSLPLFKRHCAFWLKDIIARGHGFVRTADAVAVHAPHPGLKYILWRGWQSGSDRDYEIFQEKSRSRVSRVARAGAHLLWKTGRSWGRIITKGSKVGLRPWDWPYAMAVSLGYYSAAATAEGWAAVSRSYEPLPTGKPGGESLAKRVERANA